MFGRKSLPLCRAHWADEEAGPQPGKLMHARLPWEYTTFMVVRRGETHTRAHWLLLKAVKKVTIFDVNVLYFRSV